jgi:hypothetical protein
VGAGGTPGAVPTAGPGTNNGASVADGGGHWPLARCASEQQIEPCGHVPDAGVGVQNVPSPVF